MKKALLIIAAVFLYAAQSSAHSPTAGDKYDAIRNKWKSILIGTEGNTAGKYSAAKKRAINTEAQAQWTALNKSEGRTSLWPDLTSTKLSAEITYAYRRIYAMALAYSTQGTLLYKNNGLRDDIIGALVWMNDNRYVNSYNDWWDFAIGAPLELNNCITLMYDDFSNDQRTALNNRVAKFAGDPTTDFGANRAWRAFVYGLNGVLKKDSAKISYAKNALSVLFEFATKGEGFFTDGSFIQHGNHPYNLGYGVDAIAKLSDLLYLLDGTTWQVTDPASTNLYNWIYNSFEPFIYKGVAMDMVRGREMARYYKEDYKAGFTVIGIVAKLAQFAPPADAEKFRSLVKYWVKSNKVRDYFTDAATSATTSLNTIRQVQTIVDDQSIKLFTETPFYKQFPMMDRAVKRGRGFAFGISMHSTRIADYEADIKNENIQGWHTGDGMTYLYDADLNQYSNDFWPTVDKYRLTGTTVLQQTPIASDRLSDRSWVGGVTLENLYGVSGMDFHAIGYNLQAKKAWFLFDDEVVALGAGITSNDGKVVETIVENRKLNSSGTNEASINGKIMSLRDSSREQAISKTSYAHLSGTVPIADIGYYFPAASLLKALREGRTAAWRSINGNPATTDTVLYANHFFTLWFDHGANPKNAAYSYVVLPGKSVKETMRYATHPQIKVLRNDTLVQAVKEITLNSIGAAFWTDTEQIVDIISCDKKAAVMVKESGGELMVSVSDPTMLNNGNITLKIAKRVKDVISKSDRITIVQLAPTLILSINVTGAKGSSFEAKFRL